MCGPAECPLHRSPTPRPMPRRDAGGRRRDSQWDPRTGSACRPYDEPIHRRHRIHSRSRTPRRKLGNPTGATTVGEAPRPEDSRMGNGADSVECHELDGRLQSEPVDAPSPHQDSKRTRAGRQAPPPLRPGACKTERRRHPAGSDQTDGHRLAPRPCPGTLPPHGQGKTPSHPRSPQEGEPRPSSQRGPRQVARALLCSTSGV